jgi:hypothetical protein|tara:strand:+ start:3201 stop:4166 length:966 start_codon:yes stop_codon:yes gene_type:complete
MSSNTDIRFVAPGAEGYNYNHPAAAHPVVLDAEKGIVQTVPSRKKVAIVGFASSTLRYAPFTDPTYECWGVNQLYRHVPRLDRHFDMHRNWREGNVEGTDHPAWIKQCGIPVYMVGTEKGYPNTVRYPLERVMENVSGGVDYFTSTVAFMIALAIDEGFDTIGVFGIDLIVGTEYDYQKSCVEFLLGIAHGRGINLNIPIQAALLKSTWRYGYEKEPDWGVRPSSIKKWIDEQNSTRQELVHKLYALDGAIQASEYWYAQMELKMRGGIPTVDQGHEHVPETPSSDGKFETKKTHELNGAGPLPGGVDPRQEIEAVAVADP